MSQDSVSCNGLFDGTATANNITGGTGSYNYLWDASSGSQTTNPATGLGIGPYTITVTDQNGCQVSDNVTVLEPPLLTIGSMSQDSVSCNGLFDGTATANNITGGTGSYNVLWDASSGSQTTNPATGLGILTYTITVTDQNGCQVSDNVTVLEPPLLTIGSMSQDSVSCNGLFDGTATANNITGGTGSYNY
jgi:hypothetical protein